MKVIVILFSFLFSFFTYSMENSGGKVYFGGYVFEEPCNYKKTVSHIVLTCNERDNNKKHYYQISSLNENETKIDSVKISDINLSKISMNSAITTISYR